MKLLGAVTVLAAGTGTWAADGAGTPKRVVTACLNPGANGSMVYRGQATAAQILKNTGIRLEWGRDERACAQGKAIVFTVSLETPLYQHPGALAYALPFDGTRVVLFYDRVLSAAGPAVAPIASGTRAGARDRSHLAGRQRALRERHHEAALGQAGL